MPSTWTLRLWSHGTLEGTANGTSGTLTVAVPSTNDCTFQADVTVLPPGGQRYYYSGTRATVPGCGPVSTIAGHIYLCNAAGAPTTSEVAGGTLAATGPQAVTSQPNPMAPLTVPPGSYSMTAASPSGYVLVTCGGSATIGSNGTSASEPVVVPSGGNGVGIFYVVVAAPTGSLGGGSGPGSSSGNGPPTSPGSSGGTTTAAKVSTPTKVSSTELALTGMNMLPLLLVGLMALALGAVAMWVTRLRRRPPVALATNSRRRP